MKDFYKILGVPENNADAHAIRSAYKLKASTVHPDKAGGSTEAFQELNQAYSVLRDPVKRAQYDKGEEIKLPNELELTAKGRLADMFSQAIDSAQDDKDMIDIIRSSIVTGALDFQKTIDEMNSKIDGYNHILDRVKYNGDDGVDLFAGTVNQKIDHCERTIEALSKELELVKIVTQLLNDYECSVEEPVHAPYLSGMTKNPINFETTGWYP